MKKYKVELGSWARARIDEVEIERETEHSVWIGGHRHVKHTSSTNYFNTFEKAHKELMKVAEQKVSSAKYQLDQAKGYLGNVKGLAR